MCCLKPLFLLSAGLRQEARTVSVGGKVSRGVKLPPLAWEPKGDPGSLQEPFHGHFLADFDSNRA